MWGGGDVPTTLEGVKDYVNALVVDKPLPSWIFEFIDLLYEARDTMTVHLIRVGWSISVTQKMNGLLRYCRSVVLESIRKLEEDPREFYRFG